MKNAPSRSLCEKQCDANAGLILTQSDAVGGCGVLSVGQEQLCLLKDSTTCAEHPVQQYELPFEENNLAACKVSLISNSQQHAIVNYIS